VIDDRRGAPPAGADAPQPEAAHRFGDGLTGDDLAALTQVDQDPWGAGHLVGLAVEPRDLGLDPLRA